MQNIENINYASDSGTEAIEKLDRNQRKIKDHLDSINVDEMQQQINIFSNDRGYINSKEYNELDLNNLTDNGNYWCNVYANTQNCPDNNFVGVIHVIKDGYNCVFQLANATYSNGKLWYRSKNNNGWNSWKEIVTVEQLNNALSINGLTKV